MFGVISLNKPAGWSSRAALNRVEHLVKPARVGHAGTLDPLAAGVLVVCIGPATRLIEYVQQMPKQYRATFLLGRRSASDDTETEVELLADAARPSLDDLRTALPQFRGTISQRPPAYSAVKIEGQRAYRIARRGGIVETAPRQVQVYDLAVERYEYPELVLQIGCSGGTYVRSLGRDLAERLGTAAVMSALTRTAVGEYRIEDAEDPRGLDMERLQRTLQSPLKAVSRLPRVTLPWSQLEHVKRGGLFAADTLAPGTGVGPPPGREHATLPRGTSISPESGFTAPAIAAVSESGDLVAILKEARPGWLKPSPNFLQME